MSSMTDLSHVRLSDRPLIVCDVDDVVLHFAAPFDRFLATQGYELLPRSFRLTGNIVAVEGGEALEHDAVRKLIGAMFAAQETWQEPVEAVVETLAGLSDEADIVFLTAMPPLFQDERRRLLDRLSLPFPLIASEAPKGPIMQRLHAGRSHAAVFVDDMAHNLHSVRDHTPDALLLQIMPDSPLHRLAPKPDAPIERARDWGHAAELIRAHIAG